MDSPVMSKRSCCGLVQSRFIPLILLSAFSSSPNTILLQQYAYQRYAEEAGLTPANLSFQNSSACTAEHNHTDAVQDHVQQQSSYFSMYLFVALSVPSIITLPLWGAFSDLVGRKVPLVIAFTGNILRALIFVLAVLYHWPLWVLLLGEMVHAVFGFTQGTVLYVTAAHIADYCPQKSRTLEMVLLDLWLTLGVMVGSVLSGYALKDIGYTDPVLGYAVPILCIGGIQIILIFYTLLVLPSFAPRRLEPDAGPDACTGAGSDADDVPSPPKLCNRLLNTFKTTAKKSLTVVFRSPHKELLLLAAVFCLFGAGFGALTENLTTYAMGYPLCWRALQLSIYKGALLGVQGLTATAMSLVWQRKEWRLEWLVVIGLCSAALYNLVVGTASTTPIMYTSMLAGACVIVVPPTIRSIAASMVAPTDQGALMSGLYNVFIVSRLVAIVMFNFLYTATLSTYEGIVFLVSVAFYIPCIPLVWKVYKMRTVLQDEPLIPNEEVVT